MEKKGRERRQNCSNNEQDVSSMIKDEKVINFFLLITSCYPFKAARIRAAMKHQSALPLAPEARSNFPSQGCTGHSRSEIVSFQSGEKKKRVLISALYSGIIQRNRLWSAAFFFTCQKMK